MAAAAHHVDIEGGASSPYTPAAPPLEDEEHAGGGAPVLKSPFVAAADEGGRATAPPVKMVGGEPVCYPSAVMFATDGGIGDGAVGGGDEAVVDPTASSVWEEGARPGDRMYAADSPRTLESLEREIVGSTTFWYASEPAECRPRVFGFGNIVSPAMGIIERGSAMVAGDKTTGFFPTVTIRRARVVATAYIPALRKDKARVERSRAHHVPAATAAARVSRG